MNISSNTRPMITPLEGPRRHLRLTRAHLLGYIGDLVEVKRIVVDVVAYRYLQSGRPGVCRLRELLDATKEDPE